MPSLAGWSDSYMLSTKRRHQGHYLGEASHPKVLVSHPRACGGSPSDTSKNAGCERGPGTAPRSPLRPLAAPGDEGRQRTTAPGVHRGRRRSRPRSPAHAQRGDTSRAAARRWSASRDVTMQQPIPERGVELPAFKSSASPACPSPKGPGAAAA